MLVLLMLVAYMLQDYKEFKNYLEVIENSDSCLEDEVKLVVWQFLNELTFPWGVKVCTCDEESNCTWARQVEFTQGSCHKKNIFYDGLFIRFSEPGYNFRDAWFKWEWVKVITASGVFSASYTFSPSASMKFTESEVMTYSGSRLFTGSDLFSNSDSNMFSSSYRFSGTSLVTFSEGFKNTDQMSRSFTWTSSWTFSGSIILSRTQGFSISYSFKPSMTDRPRLTITSMMMASRSFSQSRTFSVSRDFSGTNKFTTGVTTTFPKLSIRSEIVMRRSEVIPIPSISATATPSISSISSELKNKLSWEKIYALCGIGIGLVIILSFLITCCVKCCKKRRKIDNLSKDVETNDGDIYDITYEVLFFKL